MTKPDTPPEPPPPVDWSDRDQARRWIAALHAAFADMLRPVRCKRQLGHLEHVRLFNEADASITSLLDAAERGLVNGSRAPRGGT